MLCTALIVLGVTAAVMSLVSASVGLCSRSESANVTLTTDGTIEAYNISSQAAAKIRSQLQRYAEEEDSRRRASKHAPG